MNTKGKIPLLPDESAMELDAQRCIQVVFEIPVRQERLKSYFSDENRSGGGEITWLWVCTTKPSALIEFKSKTAAEGVLTKSVHITENVLLHVYQPDWIEHRTIEIRGLEQSACEKFLKRLGYRYLIENIQNISDKITIVTFADIIVARSLLSHRTSIPEGVELCPYHHKSHDLFPCRVLVRTKDDCDLQTVVDALKMHTECRQIDIFKDETGGTYLMQSAKLINSLSLKKVLQPEIGGFSVSAVFVMNWDAHIEAPFPPTTVPIEEIDEEAVDTDILSQYEEHRDENERCSAQRDRPEHQVKQLTEPTAKSMTPYEELADAKAGWNGVMEKLQGKISSANAEISNKYDELQINYEESTAQRNRLERQVKQLIESEKNLQTELATSIATNEELVRQKTDLEKMVEALQQEFRTSQSLREKINCQECLLVDKTKQILKLEASLISQSDELSARLEPLQAIPGMISRLEPLQTIPVMISSQCQEIHSHITDTADKVLDNMKSASSQIMDKVDALRNAWIIFLQEDNTDTFDDTAASLNSAGLKNIPALLKCHTERLSCTVGPNWLDVGRALDLNGDQLKRIWADWGQYGMREVTFRVIECWCSLSPARPNSLDALQTAMSQLEINPLMVERMGEDDQRMLTENYHLLVTDMVDVTHIDSYLRQAKILSAPAVEYIISPSTRQRRIQRLLKVLPFCGSRALCEFKNALMESGQTHLALALAGEQSLPTETERDVTPAVLLSCLETKKRKDETNSEQLTTITRACAEIKQQICMQREEMDKWLFRSSKAKCKNCSSLFEETALKEVG